MKSERVFVEEKSVEDREREEQERQEAEEAMAREAEAAAYKRRTVLSARQAQALAACTQALDALGAETTVDDEPYVNQARDRVLCALRANFFDPPEPMFGPTFWQTVVDAVSQQLPNIVAMSASMRTPPSPSAEPAPTGAYRVRTPAGDLEVVASPSSIGGYAVRPAPAAPSSCFTATADGQVTPPSDAQKQRIRESFEQIAPTLGRLDLSYVEELLVSEMVKRDQEELRRKSRQG